jgi:hypothetical protein
MQTLGEFFGQSGLMYRVFDIGRRIQPIANSTFAAFESGQFAWPMPYKQHAWLGVLMWNPENNEQHSVWFLQLPLDEQNLLVAAGRDYLVGRIIAAIGEEKQGADILKDNPFAFSPNDDKLAAFTAIAKQSLALKSDLAMTKHIFLEGFYEGWEKLKLQHVADFCAQLNVKQQLQLSKNIVDMPNQALATLCGQLENTDIELPLSQALIQRADQSIELWPAILRGLSRSKASGLIAQSLLHLSDYEYITDLILVLMSRAYNHLIHDELRAFCLTQLHQHFSDENFAVLLSDLLTVSEINQLLRVNIKNNPSINDRLLRLTTAQNNDDNDAPANTVLH